MRQFKLPWALLVLGLLLTRVNNAVADDVGAPLRCAHHLVESQAPRSFLARKLTPALSLSDLHPRFDFADLASAALYLRALYPSETHYVVGIGRSPFGIVEMMNLLAPASATSVQISYNEYLRKRPLVIMAPWKRALEPFSRGPRRAALFEYFNKVIPSAREIGDRRIVILDFADYGSSLIKFSVDLAAYLEAERRPVDHEAVFVGVRRHTDAWYLHAMAEEMLPAGVVHALMPPGQWVWWWLIPQFPEFERALRARLPRFKHVVLERDLTDLGELLDGEEFKRFAPYAHFTPERLDAPDVPPEAPAFARFRRVLRLEFERRCRGDAEFRARAPGCANVQ